MKSRTNLSAFAYLCCTLPDSMRIYWQEESLGKETWNASNECHPNAARRLQSQTAHPPNQVAAGWWEAACRAGVAVSAWAKPGVKCVCVDAEWYAEDLGSRRTPDPIKGQTYTIDEVVDGGEYIGIVGFSLTYFETSGFRPLITQQDDVALFTHLLTGTPVRELVE